MFKTLSNHPARPEGKKNSETAKVQQRTQFPTGCAQWTRPWGTITQKNYTEKPQKDLRFAMNHKWSTFSQINMGNDKRVTQSNVQAHYHSHGKVAPPQPCVASKDKNKSLVNFGNVSKVRYVTESADAGKSVFKPVTPTTYNKVVNRFDLFNGRPMPQRSTGFDYWDPDARKSRQSNNFTELPPDGNKFNPLTGKVISGTIF